MSSTAVGQHNVDIPSINMKKNGKARINYFSYNCINNLMKNIYPLYLKLLFFSNSD